MQKERNRKKHGMVLIVALWIVLTLAGLVLVFGRSMRTELLVTANRVAASKAEWIARGALAYSLSLIDETDGISRPWENAAFEAVALGDGYFWLLDTGAEDNGFHRFGISDESAKVNLSHASIDMLLALPGMTDELAASVVDWRSPDMALSAVGAGDEYYLLLSPPYYCKSGPFETVEEILLVKGATMEILFGEDRNRNGVPDTGENSETGWLDRGIYRFLTVHTTEANATRGTAEREEAINVNRAGSRQLANLLQDSVEQNRLPVITSVIRRERPFQNTLDFFYRSGLTFEEFKPLAERVTVGGRARRAGLINANTASRQVLASIPGLVEADAEEMILRRFSPDADLSNISWVAEVLPPEKGIEAGNWLTVRSYQFSVDIIAASGDGRAFKRYRAVIDARDIPPRVISWQDMTGLGWPLEPDILLNLRKGMAPA